MIRFGVGALAEAPDLLRASGFKNYALLTTERGQEQFPQVAENAYLVAHVPHGPVPEVAAAVRERVNDRPLVALGGGRVIDAAKAIAGADQLRSAAIPTTLSGAEMTPFHRMPEGVEELQHTRPALVLGAPGLMASQPMPDLAASAMNALAHAFEALYTPRSNPVARMAALRSAELIAAGLADAEPDKPSLALGALLAGYASGLAGFAVHHAVCQTIVRMTGSPHAQTNAIMLPHFVRVMELRAREETEAFGVALGAERRRGAAAEAVERLVKKAEAGKLSYYGVEASHLSAVVEAVSARAELQNTPEPPSEGELRGVLERAL
ncbi:MAG TPA: iron-containing alcohol dehydrogenase [Solirubrobacterales bacterium]|nr:iron-containing alcohol dehydrogenase [Solirubrobacterales bacterium]